MNDQERQALQTVLDDAVAQRQELDVVIKHIAHRLNVPVPTGPNGNGRSANNGGLGNGVSTRLGVDPVEGTSEAEYFGYTSTDAAYAVLDKFGDRQHTLKTKQLYDAIKKGGVSIATEDGLYRSLARSHRFRKVGRGLWGLDEWYPHPPKARKNDATNVSSLTTDDAVAEASETDEDAEVQTA